MDRETVHAHARFGLGAGGGDAPLSDPVAWLISQARQLGPRSDGAATAEGLAALRADRDDKPPAGEARARALYRTQGLAAIGEAVTSKVPFREHLVWFWSNHFTVSLRRGICTALAGGFVADAIRPHVAGRFEDMLLAVLRHPAMLLYLDNAGSTGPNSPGGQKGRRGLNENLARECLELHTVSPEAKYTQADVTEFARVLTGWSTELKTDPLGFVFRPRLHEPGAHTVMGRALPEGEAGGIAAAKFLANHPATHRHLATKLARHFIADTPPPAAVRAIEAILLNTGGDLGAAAAGLVALPDAWTPGTKFRTPMELMVAAFRALGPLAESPPAESPLAESPSAESPPAEAAPPYLGILSGLGQPLWTAPAPDGWSSLAAAWSGPEAMMRRVDWAYAVAQRIGERDPVALAGNVLGPLFRPATHDAMVRAGSRRDAMTLLLTSPEFQRR